MKPLSLVLALLGCLQYFVAADFQVDALYEMTMNLSDNYGVLKDWRNNQMSPCYWVNINCQDNNVISITLTSSGLSGVLSPSIAKLTALQQLLLDGNSLTGAIPEEFGNLPSLTTLKLGRNRLKGSIPGSLGRLLNLQNLDLNQNILSGNIPSSLSNLPLLNDINLADNNLNGEIPKQLLQVAQYNYTGNHLNCGQHLFSCEGGSTPPGNQTKRMLWIVGTVLSLVAAFTCFTFCIRWIRSHRKDKQQDEELEWSIEQSNSDFTIFHFSQVSKATKVFSEENKLGQGGFGPVYKGQFVDGLEIAVKRLASCSRQGLREFKNEVQLIAKLQHRNLVRLLGCCSQGEDKMLVYEYLPNKSFDFFIFDETRRTLLGWNKHLMIIEGIAQGFLYLHKHSRLRVVHRDIKASNVLLDSEMNPKISDFGLARMFSSDDTDGNTKRVVGTYGYMAPEYASEGLFSTKSDVFSFGVLILEIVTGKRNSHFHQHEDFLNLLGYAWQLWREGRWLELVDASLVAESHHTSEMMRCINIALLCVQETADDRPTMSDVVVMLSSTSMILPEPKQPAYFHVRVATEEMSTVEELCSANDVTITSPRGR